MKTALSGITGLVVTIGLWLVRETLAEIPRRLGARIARWLFPKNQATTFRLAQAFALLARVVGPRKLLEGADWRLIFAASLPTLIRGERRWLIPDAVLDHLASDLASGLRTDAPVRLVIPVLALAASLRARHVVYRAQIAVALVLVFGCGLVVVLALAAVGLVVFVFAPPLFAALAILERIAIRLEPRLLNR